MSTSVPNSVLHLHLVPAGRRLDFARRPGSYAHVYRRHDYADWQCIARNACSPFIDPSPLPPGTPTEYVVLYYCPGGQVTAATPIVPVGPQRALARRRG
jgi:hypothetical protein